MVKTSNAPRTSAEPLTNSVTRADAATGQRLSDRFKAALALDAERQQLESAWIKGERGKLTNYEETEIIHRVFSFRGWLDEFEQTFGFPLPAYASEWLRVYNRLNADRIVIPPNWATPIQICSYLLDSVKTSDACTTGEAVQTEQQPANDDDTRSAKTVPVEHMEAIITGKIYAEPNFAPGFLMTELDNLDPRTLRRVASQCGIDRSGLTGAGKDTQYTRDEAKRIASHQAAKGKTDRQRSHALAFLEKLVKADA